LYLALNGGNLDLCRPELELNTMSVFQNMVDEPGHTQTKFVIPRKLQVKFAKYTNGHL
jgi:hypothetical protein